MPPNEKARDRRTLALLATSAAAFAMLQTLVSPVLSAIQQQLGTTHETVSWVLIAYLLAAAVATPVLGKIGDLVAKDRALRIALSTLALGCLVAALAPNVTVLLVGRVLQGCGGAVFPLSFGIVRDEFPPNRVPTAIGVLSGVLGLGGGIGLGMAYATLTSLVVQAVPATQTGTVSGMNANIRTIGGAVGTALVTAIVTADPQATGSPKESGFVAGVLTLALMATAATMLCQLVPASRQGRLPRPKARCAFRRT